MLEISGLLECCKETENRTRKRTDNEKITKTKNEDNERSRRRRRWKVRVTLTMWERQVHWYGCNALSIRLVNHVASMPICPWYHLFVSLLLVFFLCLLVRDRTFLSLWGSNNRQWSSLKVCPNCSEWTGCNFCQDQFRTPSHWFSCSTRQHVNFSGYRRYAQ